jgi:aspartate-semialdehyde dehydrogenase
MFDFVSVPSTMKKDVIKALEEAYAKPEPGSLQQLGHRWTPDVPMVIPEINPEHIGVIEYRESALAPQPVLLL